jgi:hypothetical protein
MEAAGEAADQESLRSEAGALHAWLEADMFMKPSLHSEDGRAEYKVEQTGKYKSALAPGADRDIIPIMLPGALGSQQDGCAGTAGASQARKLRGRCVSEYAISLADSPDGSLNNMIAVGLTFQPDAVQKGNAIRRR